VLNPSECGGVYTSFFSDDPSLLSVKKILIIQIHFSIDRRKYSIGTEYLFLGRKYP